MNTLIIVGAFEPLCRIFCTRKETV